MSGKGIFYASIFVFISFFVIHIGKEALQAVWFDFILSNPWLLLSFYIFITLIFSGILILSRIIVTRKKDIVFFGLLGIIIYVCSLIIILSKDIASVPLVYTGACNLKVEFVSGKLSHAKYYVTISDNGGLNKKFKINENQFILLGGKKEAMHGSMNSFTNDFKCKDSIELKYLKKSNFIISINTY